MTPKARSSPQNDDVENADEPPLTHQADSRLEFKIPADGDYVLRIGDAQRKGGDEYAYRLIIAPDRPDFDLRHSVGFPAAGSPRATRVAATVTAIRRGGYNGEIRLALEDVPTGFVMRGGVISQKQGWEDGNETRLTITAPADAAGGILTPRIVATAQIEGKEVVRPLVPTVAMKQAFSINHLVPVAEFHVNIAAKERGFVLATDVPADACPGSRAGRRSADPAQGRARHGRRGRHRAGARPAALGIFGQASAQIEAGKSECTLSLKVDKVGAAGEAAVRGLQRNDGYRQGEMGPLCAGDPD